MPGAEITGVTGGSAGMAATYDALRSLADTFDSAGDQLRHWAALGARTLADPDLAESAVLSPVTFAEAECAVLAATAGPEGVLAASAGWELDAVLVRSVVIGFEAADLAAHEATEELDRRIGQVAGVALGASAPVVAPALVLVAPHLPPQAGNAMEGWLVGHPGLVQHAVNGGGGLLEGVAAVAGIPLLTPDTGAGAGLLALTYGDDGTGVATVRDDVEVPDGSTQPADLEGLVRHLQDVAHLSPDPGSALNGTIEIQTIGAGTDHVRHIVYLPGTDDMTTLPWTRDGDVRDLPTDLLLVAGRDNAYQQGILDAMTQAGIGPREPVLLVGHSQGGMEAAAILSQGSDFTITNVVTAGSPTAQVDGFPVGSHVLSLEHQGDVVPLTDGEPNPDSVQQTTVAFTDAAAGEGVVAHHGYEHYVAGAAAADGSGDPSVAEQLSSLHTHGFLAAPDAPAPAVTSHVYQVVRQP